MIGTRRTLDGCYKAAGRGAARALAVALLATIALVPPLARAHDRLHAAPIDEYSRFHWTNSCESVPQKIARAVVVVPVESPAPTTIEMPSRAWQRLPRASAPRTADPLPVSSRSLRAPPTVL